MPIVAEAGAALPKSRLPVDNRHQSKRITDESECHQAAAETNDEGRGDEKRMIDLGSDTATRPSAEMRRYMADAPVGDEQLREDPTVNRLERMVAELTGKEDAMFLPSGTMCNGVGIKVHTQPGDRILLERFAHPNTSEGGGPALMSGVLIGTILGRRGIFTPEQVRAEA
ncbi:MAG TPA: beta-eliminating lyase-related protein, partial [Thermomicrobiaceae bacterium]|nr:beta-eliminating lyase-related protein [Thermomicrobiaceae bacterium]